MGHDMESASFRDDLTVEIDMCKLNQQATVLGVAKATDTLHPTLGVFETDSQTPPFDDASRSLRAIDGVRKMGVDTFAVLDAMGSLNYKHHLLFASFLLK